MDEEECVEDGERRDKKGNIPARRGGGVEAFVL